MAVQVLLDDEMMSVGYVYQNGRQGVKEIDDAIVTVNPEETNVHGFE